MNSRIHRPLVGGAEKAATRPSRESADGGGGATEYDWDRSEELSQKLPSRPSHLLIGEREQRLYVFRPECVEYIKGDGNYVKIHAGNSDYIGRDSIKRLSVLLAERGFFRIERSFLINVRAIAYIQRAGRGTYTFTMASGACLRSGARYREHILRVLPLAAQKTATSFLGIEKPSRFPT